MSRLSGSLSGPRFWGWNVTANGIPFGHRWFKKGGWRFFFGKEQSLHVGIYITHCRIRSLLLTPHKTMIFPTRRHRGHWCHLIRSTDPCSSRPTVHAPSKHHGRRCRGLVSSNSSNWRSRNAKTATTTSFFAILMSDENVVDYDDDDGHDNGDDDEDEDDNTTINCWQQLGRRIREKETMTKWRWRWRWR